MKVRELISTLSLMDPNLDVVIETDGWPTDIDRVSKAYAFENEEDEFEITTSIREVRSPSVTVVSIKPSMVLADLDI